MLSVRISVACYDNGEASWIYDQRTRLHVRPVLFYAYSDPLRQS
jgi:hypothetical protein